jgi:tetratricopeptide repeat protein
MTVEQKTWYIVLMVYVALMTAVVEGKQPGVLLQEGLYAEEIDGDLDKAIGVYQQVVDDPQATEAQGAQSLYRMGMCYLKKQDELKAKGAFQTLIKKYPQQKKVIDKIRPLLAKLVDLDPASLMPPHTKIYFEIGSPGRQIEKIMNMLQGTPLENPLEMLSGVQGDTPPPDGAGPGGQTPMGILSALLNPSMMAELKKIRGIAVGITEVRQSNPPMIAVLNPGKSDALRGIILAALGMIGQPGAPMEGMQTRSIQVSGPLKMGVAHDDNIILFSMPQEQLAWCVKQYKGITNEPTLVTAHKQFAKIPRERRLENTFTLWVDGKETYKALAPMLGEDFGAFGLIDGLVNFGSIQEVLAEFAIEEAGFTFEGNVHLDSDHRCLPYQMFRTPNLRKSGFVGVPANAIAVLSFALGGPEGALATQTSESIKAATGLDIGREIFDNIEQVTVFAVPVPEALNEDIFAQELSPLIHSIGVAITSRNPEKTRTLLSQLLHAGEAFTCVMFNRTFPEESDPIRPKYFVAGIPGPEHFQELYLHIDQVEHTTVLALNRQVIDASVAAVRSEKSVLTQGPLQKSLAQLPKDTSKLLLVNVGGALGLFESHMRATELAGKEDHPLFDILAKLKKGFAATMVQMRTGETANHLAVRMSIEDLPPLAEVFPTLMQIPQMMMGQEQREDQLQASQQLSIEERFDMIMNKIGGREKLSPGSLEAMEVKLLATPDSGRFEEYRPDADIYQNRVRQSDKGYSIITGGLQDGQMIYSDRDFRLTNIPETLQGLTMLQTMNGHKQEEAASFQIKIQCNQAGCVFVAIDPRMMFYWGANSIPEWIRGYRATDYRIVSDDPDIGDLGWNYLVVGKEVSSGEVILGPPMGTGGSSMYFAFFGKQDGT